MTDRTMPVYTAQQSRVFLDALEAGLPQEEAHDRAQRMRLTSFTARELQALDFPPRRTYIEDLVAEGATILGGKPKLGKSWFALRLAVTIATNGVAFGNRERSVEPAPVLYLALEDGGLRLKDRIASLLDGAENWPDDLRFDVQWPVLTNGGLEQLDQVIRQDGFGVVVIDTLQRIRGPRRTKDPYGEDYETLGSLHDLARSIDGLALWVVHHNRKNESADDYIDALSGSTGITGAVDHIAVLTRGRNQADAVLHFTSRDLPEHDTAYSFAGGNWIELGAAAVYEMSRARRALLIELFEQGGEATLKDLATGLGRKPPTVLKLLRSINELVPKLVEQPKERGPWVLRKTANSANELISQLPELAGFSKEEGSP